ncbi:uncharacterized protein MELLADRAFT_90179 [Melampsora larici-populina 98AG31]|uniref:Uncharacterized protein n=1 Tax=Melampsora larici-populina (strain 98AG31 / pathotype 3-4-7) TaxID=747676 RepID=F4RW03_MELLP|nr:uncharacterized protein MELLADRAFT_90179 [Melampsora larici-populina 98AG31]EGG03493.1 hypothetical protein MELLADRAFT_90179 [Melampsora larici-populina 98AG31]
MNQIYSHSFDFYPYQQLYFTFLFYYYYRISFFKLKLLYNCTKTILIINFYLFLQLALEHLQRPFFFIKNTLRTFKSSSFLFNLFVCDIYFRLINTSVIK